MAEAAAVAVEGTLVAVPLTAGGAAAEAMMKTAGRWSRKTEQT